MSSGTPTQQQPQGAQSARGALEEKIARLERTTLLQAAQLKYKETLLKIQKEQQQVMQEQQQLMQEQQQVMQEQQQAMRENHDEIVAQLTQANSDLEKLAEQNDEKISSMTATIESMSVNIESAQNQSTSGDVTLDIDTMELDAFDKAVLKELHNVVVVIQEYILSQESRIERLASAVEQLDKYVVYLNQKAKNYANRAREASDPTHTSHYNELSSRTAKEAKSITLTAKAVRKAVQEDEDTKSKLQQTLADVRNRLDSYWDRLGPIFQDVLPQSLGYQSPDTTEAEYSADTESESPSRGSVPSGYAVGWSSTRGGDQDRGRGRESMIRQTVQSTPETTPVALLKSTKVKKSAADIEISRLKDRQTLHRLAPS